MRVSFIEQVKKHEGFRSRPYRDTTGHLTIGYGRNLDSNGIREDEATDLLIDDLVQARHECFLNFAGLFENLSEARQNVLTEMVFNMGIAKVKTFKKMFIALELKDYDLAALEMVNSKWAEQVGKRAVTLAKQMKEG